jgi:hypothetical protein
MKQLEELTAFERAVLEKLLDGDNPLWNALRLQLSSAMVEEREWTGVGFYTTLHVPDGAAAAPELGAMNVGAGVHAEIPGLEHGAGFVLWIRDGFLDCLEGYCYDETWNEPPLSFTLSSTRKQIS